VYGRPPRGTLIFHPPTNAIDSPKSFTSLQALKRCLGFSRLSRRRSAFRQFLQQSSRFRYAHVFQHGLGVPEIPWGAQRRMPHGINYIHGSAHYNSGILLFTDFADAIEHFTDQRFAAEVRRFARAERREILVMFRQRDYSPRDYAYYVGCMRTLFPWFCNSNGPNKRVLWGNPSPFPVANIITGNWLRDIYRLKKPGGAEAVVRPPLAVAAYFQRPPYRGCRREPLWPEKLLARYTYWRIRLRGARGGLFFVDRRRLLADNGETRREKCSADEPIARF
jgi:hypothetical protein